MSSEEKTYEEFIKEKVAFAKPMGIEIDPAEVHPILKPHQRDTVVWACRGGRRGIFLRFGLGKSLIQLSICDLMTKHIGPDARALIVCPLGVRQEFARDAKLIDLRTEFIQSIVEKDDHERQSEFIELGRPIYLTNYESVRSGKLDPTGFDVVCLDEAAILRGFGSTLTFRRMMQLFEGTSTYRFVATATPDPNEYIELAAYADWLGVMETGEIKAQPLDAKILTPTGWKTMGEMRVGQEVIAGDGTVTKVVGVFPQGERQAYRVRFNDGSSTECDMDHLWLTWSAVEKQNESKQNKYAESRAVVATEKKCYATVKSTAEIAVTLKSDRGLNHHIPLVGCVQFTEQKVEVDPYLLGVLLGDGHLRHDSIELSCGDEWLVDKVESIVSPDYKLKKRSGFSYAIVGAYGRKGIGRGVRSNAIMNGMRSYGLLGSRSWNKHVPAEYLFNSKSVRLGVLQGLMDTDGTWNKRSGCIFNTASHQLAMDVRAIVLSLGGASRIWQCKTIGRDSFYVSVRLPDGMVPFSLPRKAKKVKSSETERKRGREVLHGRSKKRRIVSVELSSVKPMQCIAVEHPDRLYVTDDFIVTHNTRFFKRDSTKADKLTLHDHKRQEFWEWVATWGLFVQKPSDLGYSDEGYDLPPLNVNWHEIPSDTSTAAVDRRGQMRMFKDVSMGLSEAAREKRESLGNRIGKMREIIAESPDDNVMIWCDLEAERKEIEKVLPGCRSVYGSQKWEAREQAILDFANGNLQYLSSKASMLGAGVNLQRHCHRALFLGIGFKFNDFIQAIHRIYRFLQDSPVTIDLIYTEAEHGVRQVLEGKWQRYDEQCKSLAEIIQKYGLAENAMSGIQRTMDVERREVATDKFRVINNDTVRETESMEDNSVGLIVTSIPFAFQYEYTPSFLDFGHTDSNDHFWQQMDYLSPNLLRVLQPGRVMCIHVKDRIVPGGLSKLGFQTLHPFHAEAIFHYQRHGFAFLGMKTVVTDVVRENNQTYRLGWTEQCKDGSRMGCGVPEYVLLFRKPPTDRSDGYADVPVLKHKPDMLTPDEDIVPYDASAKSYDANKIVPGTGYSRAKWQFDAHGFQRSSGNRFLTLEEMEELPHKSIFRKWRDESLTTIYDYERHVELGEIMERDKRLPSTFMNLPPHSWHPDVWTDVARMRTLNMIQQRKGQQQHLCPLQWDIVNRLIVQLSNEGDVVFDPFGGLMTVPYCAVKLGRFGLGVELNAGYFADGVRYCHAASVDADTPSLFGLIDEESKSTESEKDEADDLCDDE